MSSEEEHEEAGAEAGEDDACPPPPEEEKELLFLIEFLIDTMLLKPENMEIGDMDPCLLQEETQIVLTFLHFPPMTINEKGGDPCKQTGTNYIKFNAGKSLMFALSESQFENPPSIYLQVSAYKKLPHGSVPTQMHVGTTKICLSELFKQVFEKVDENPEKLPLSKSIKDNYQLMGMRKNCPTAEVTIYIRLSCLGQNVVTEFQRGGDECDPFLFRSKESNKVYQCKIKDAPGEVADDICPPLPGWGASAGPDCGGDGFGGGGGGGGAGGGTCGGPPPENFNNGPTMGSDDEYDEFGTEVHGHSLSVKVQKSSKKQDGSQLAQSGDDGNEITFQIPQSTKLCKKGKSSNKANVYNISGPNVQTCGGKPPPPQGIDSIDKDIFILRIGKKGDSSEKGKLELELRTPKLKNERPPSSPRKVSKIIQTDKDDKDGKGKKGRK